MQLLLENDTTFAASSLYSFFSVQELCAMSGASKQLRAIASRALDATRVVFLSTQQYVWETIYVLPFALKMKNIEAVKATLGFEDQWEVRRERLCFFHGMWACRMSDLLHKIEKVQTEEVARNFFTLNY